MGGPGWWIMPERTSLLTTISTGCPPGIFKAAQMELLTTNYPIENSFIWPTTYGESVYFNIALILLLLLLRSENYVLLKVKLVDLHLTVRENVERIHDYFFAFQAWLLALCATLSTFSPLWCTGCRAPKAMPGRQTPPYTISTGSPRGSSSSRLRVV